MDTKVTFFQRHPLTKDLVSLALFVVCVVVGTILLNAYVFRSYNVVGVSMENTLHGNDRLIVNRLPVTWAHFLGQEYKPERGQIIVFANGPASGPLTCEPQDEETRNRYIIKRVIAFPGERVTVKDGVMKVYNDEYPDGFVYDEQWRGEVVNGEATEGPKLETSGEVDITVPDGEVFVSGDNRVGEHSKDSRNGLGTIPYCRIIGPVALRIYPFNQIRLF